MLRLITILGFQNRALTRPRIQTFKIRLKDESRVGTRFAEIWLGVIFEAKLQWVYQVANSNNKQTHLYQQQNRL